MKYELGGKIMRESATARAKAYSYLTDNTNKDKNAKKQKRVPQREKLNSKIIKTVQKQPNLKIK